MKKFTRFATSKGFLGFAWIALITVGGELINFGHIFYGILMLGTALWMTSQFVTKVMVWSKIRDYAIDNEDVIGKDASDAIRTMVRKMED